MEQQLTCRLLSVINCPVEQRRFSAYDTWINYYPKLSWPANSNLSVYFDAIITNASSLVSKSKSKFKQVYFSIAGHTFEIYSNDKGRNFLNEKASKSSGFTCLDSNDLTIKCLPKLVNNSDSYFASIDISFSFPKGSTPSSLSFSFKKFNTSEFGNGLVVINIFSIKKSKSRIF